MIPPAISARMLIATSNIVSRMSKRGAKQPGNSLDSSYPDVGRTFFSASEAAFQPPEHLTGLESPLNAAVWDYKAYPEAI